MKGVRVPAAILALVVAIVLPLTKTSEGRVHHTYLDPVGIPTLCDGHTGADVHMGDVKTDAQCDDILMADLAKHDDAIGQCVDLATLTPGQHAAFLDTAFNLGAATFCGSGMAKAINAGHPEQACRMLPLYSCVKVKPGTGDSSGVCSNDKRDHHVLGGLLKRRQRAQVICEATS